MRVQKLRRVHHETIDDGPEGFLAVAAFRVVRLDLGCRNETRRGRSCPGCLHALRAQTFICVVRGNYSHDDMYGIAIESNRKQRQSGQ